MSSNNDGSSRAPSFGQMFLAMLGGAAVGAAAVYLTAPRSGAETRRRLQDAADDARDTVERVPQALRKATEAARDAFNESLQNGIEIRPV